MPTGDFKIPIGYIWTDCGGWIPASPYFGPIMTTSPAPSAIPRIDVTTEGPEGHWDYEDIKRLCEYRDSLRSVITEAFEATCEGCPDCNGCGNAHDILRAALPQESEHAPKG